MLVSKCTLGHCDALGETARRPRGSSAARRSAFDQPVFFASTSPSSTFSHPICSQRPSEPLRGPRVRRTAPCRKRLGQRGQRPLLPLCEVDAPNPMPVRSTSGRPAAPPTATLVLNAAVLSSCRHRRTSWSVGSRPRLGPLSRLWGPPHSSSESLKAATLAVTGQAASLRIEEATVRLPPTHGSSTRGLHFRRQSREFHLPDTQCHVSVMSSGYHAGSC